MVGTDIPGVHNDRADDIATVKIVTARDTSAIGWMGIMIGLPLIVLLFGGIALWIGGII